MARGAVDPRMLSRLGSIGAFPFFATIQQRVVAQSGTGQIVRGSWTTIVGMESIPARRGPMSGSKARVGEEKKVFGDVEHALYLVALQGNYPTINESMRLVLSDGVTYDIIDIDWDSTTTWTVLYVRAIRPSAEPGL